MNPELPGGGSQVDDRMSDDLPVKLERGELVCFAQCPFPLPAEADLELLRQQEQGQLAHKNISYNPHSGNVSGYIRKSQPNQARRLQEVFRTFSTEASRWLRQVLPGYASALTLDRASFRPLEEATRRLRLTARNDLLHIDSFRNRPSYGRRILRLFVNINPHEPRVWITSDSFSRLLDRFRDFPGFPGLESTSWLRQLRQSMLRVIKAALVERSPYDDFMLRFHDFLKRCTPFQESAPKRLWTFPPGSAWMAMTDSLSHAVLRGRFALEHSFFIARDGLARPEKAPEALLGLTTFPHPYQNRVA